MVAQRLSAAGSNSSTRTAADQESGYASDSRKETEIATLLLRNPRDPRKDLERIPVSGTLGAMIRSFGDKPTEALFHDERVRQFAGIARRAKRKLEAINAASRLDDLSIPPSNRLEKLKGDLEEVSFDPDQRSMASDL
jgi:hypothetical protein